MNIDELRRCSIFQNDNGCWCCGLAFVVKVRVGREMLGDISYHKATLQSEGKQSIHIHTQPKLLAL